MIYLILTASLTDGYGLSNSEQRMEQYKTSITKTLEYLPTSIQPIIVENNGLRKTGLDHFVHQGKPVSVCYTSHNQEQHRHKGTKEVMDLHAVIRQFHIQPNDIIIKLTGRYHMLSSAFFEEIIEQEKNYDAFVKFYGSCSLKFERNDCILGCYAIRAMFLLLWNPHTISNYSSAEVAFARYVRTSITRLKEMNWLDLHCIFAEDNRTLDV
jgi:tRNA G37 N-methylase Trm5